MTKMRAVALLLTIAPATLGLLACGDDEPPSVRDDMAAGQLGAGADSPDAQGPYAVAQELERERERLLAEREAAVAEREAAVAKREAAVRPAAQRAPAPRRAPAPTRVVERYEEPVYEAPVRRTRSSGAVTVPGGTSLELSLLDSLSSATAVPGDSVRARVSSDVYEDGRLAIPAGSEVVGVVSEAVPLRRVGGRARLGLEFNRLELPSGESVPISADYLQIGKSETGKDVATIGGATVAGAVLGREIGGRRDRDRNTAIGAVVGAATGTAIANRTRGREIQLPAGTVLNVALDGSVAVRAAG
jgi:hypothetical protein